MFDYILYIGRCVKRLTFWNVLVLKISEINNQNMYMLVTIDSVLITLENLICFNSIIYN